MLADKPFERRDSGLVLLEQIGGGCVLVKVAGFVLLNPDADQVSADVVAFGEPMKGLAGKKLLSDLALELNAVRALLGHGLPSFESPAQGSILSRPIVQSQGPTP